ncbi:MAG: ABC transporter permease [Gemmatimonadales bacterium]
MLTGFWKLTWVETKIFLREPMGVFGTLGIPVLLFIVMGKIVASESGGSAVPAGAPFNVAILGALIIAVSAVQSLVAIIAIYREGGILKRLRATPLSPVTILSAQVFLKLVLTVVGLALLVLAGRRVLPGALEVPLPSFTVALLLGTASILCVGFIIASLVPTARFAQPLSAALLYPMVVLSGLFFPIAALPPALRAVVYALPTTHAVALMQGIWDGQGWIALSGEVLALAAIAAVSLLISSRVFRWE